MALFFTVLLLAWIPLLTGLRFPAKLDEATFHLPAIFGFSDAFPSLTEMNASNLAMFALFHAVMGRIADACGGDVAVLRAVTGLIALLGAACFAACARRLGTIDWRAALLLLAAFPYFGATYFVVMSEHPAFFFIWAAILGQIWFLQTRRASALWLAGLAGLGAVFVRQNLIFLTLGFGIVLWLEQRRAARRVPLMAYLPVALPFAGLAFLLLTWSGLTPPGHQLDAHFLTGGLTTYLLSLVSVSANVGYYFVPFMPFILWRARGELSPKALLAIAAFALLGLLLCVTVRGGNLINTYGTFAHVLDFLRRHVAGLASHLLLAAALASFGMLVHLIGRSLRRAAAARSTQLLLVVLLGLGLFVVAFGVTRIYERYILPLVAIAILLLLLALNGRPARQLRGIVYAVALFGAFHSLVYGVDVYELAQWMERYRRSQTPLAPAGTQRLEVPPEAAPAPRGLIVPGSESASCEVEERLM